MSVLFPRARVAVPVRTFRAFVSKFCSEMGDFGLDTAQMLMGKAAETVDNVEKAVVNASFTAMPRIAGASELALLAVGSGAQLPALPPRGVLGARSLCRHKGVQIPSPENLT